MSPSPLKPPYPPGLSDAEAVKHMDAVREAREQAATELVGALGYHLGVTAERQTNGDVLLRLGPATFASLVGMFNRATTGDPIDAESIGR